MRLVILESPYSGTPRQISRNIAYARACIVDSLMRGEAPIASYLLYTQTWNFERQEALTKSTGNCCWPCLDEIPGAYKDIDAVMAQQSDLVAVVHTLKQVLCVKGA